jgi:hypothetical protein
MSSNHLRFFELNVVQSLRLFKGNPMNYFHHPNDKVDWQSGLGKKEKSTWAIVGLY